MLCVEPSFNREPLPLEAIAKIEDLMQSRFAQKTVVFRSRSGITATEDPSCPSYLISNIGEVHQVVRSCVPKNDEKMSTHSYEQFVGIFENVLDLSLIHI